MERKMLYEGKAKQIFETDDEDLIVIHYKDDATAFNGIKKAQITNKGVLNNKITDILYKMLEEKGIPTHYVEMLNDRDELCKKVQIFPLEVIVRNVIAGSLSKRLGIEEGTESPNTIIELCYKNDALGDPMINDTHALAIKAITKEELDEVYKLTYKINEILKEFFDKRDIILVDFKIEFGKTRDGQVVLADEISPDTARLWDKNTKMKLDKDRFRRDMGNVQEAYVEILNRISK